MDRTKELLSFVKHTLDGNMYNVFDYHNWDGYIECDESLTIEELKWLRNNVEVTVKVKLKK